jgi:hypothetical protein
MPDRGANRAMRNAKEVQTTSTFFRLKSSTASFLFYLKNLQQIKLRMADWKQHDTNNNSGQDFTD